MPARGIESAPRAAADPSVRGGRPGPTAGSADADATRAVELALEAAGLRPHRPAVGEWGLALACAGGPLHVGLALREGLLRLVAAVVGPGLLDEAWLLHRNRRDLVLVRYGTGADGSVWVHGELPPAGLAPAAVDALLARTHEAAAAARLRAWGPADDDA